jgi:hypothetical protein
MAKELNYLCPVLPNDVVAWGIGGARAQQYHG